MKRQTIFKYMGIAWMSLFYAACGVSPLLQRTENKVVPAAYQNSTDTTNSARIRRRDFFTDPYLNALIDTALSNNQQLKITLMEINVSQNEIRSRKSAYLPTVGLAGAAGVERSGRFTRNGAVDANTDIKPGQRIPDPLPDFFLGATASWEADIWKKLRNSRKAAVYRYLS